MVAAANQSSPIMTVFIEPLLFAGLTAFAVQHEHISRDDPSLLLLQT